MSLYQFVFKETAKGKADHDNHLTRRQDATNKGAVIGVYRKGDVAENSIAGSWYYTWVVDASSINALTLFLQESARYGFVELYSGPTPVSTEEDSSEIASLSAKLKAAFPESANMS
jgi:hypothetical protein